MCPEQVPRRHTAGSAGALPGPAPLAGLPAVWPGARPAFTPQFPFCKAGTQQDPWLCLGLNELISLRVVGKAGKCSVSLGEFLKLPDIRRTSEPNENLRTAPHPTQCPF